MQGLAKARQAAREEQIGNAWLAARMQAQASIGKLKPLDDWLKLVRPQPKRTVRDMILTLQDAAARGGKMTFRKVKG